jgi:hypothetical protein
MFFTSSFEKNVLRENELINQTVSYKSFIDRLIDKVTISQQNIYVKTYMLTIHKRTVYICMHIYRKQRKVLLTKSYIRVRK